MIAEKLMARMLGKIKSGLGLSKLESLARKMGAPIKLLPMGNERLSVGGAAEKHKATLSKILPGIMAAAARLGERPIGGKTATVAARPLFEKKGT